MRCNTMVEILQQLHPFIERIMPIYLLCLYTEGKNTASLFRAWVAWLWLSKNLCSSGFQSRKKRRYVSSSYGRQYPDFVDATMFWGSTLM